MVKNFQRILTKIGELIMDHYMVKEIKTGDGKLRFVVVKDNHDKEWRHVFQSKADAEHRRRQLNAHGEYRSV